MSPSAICRASASYSMVSPFITMRMRVGRTTASPSS